MDFDVWRIRTQISESGATIVVAPTDVYVDKRHKLTRAERLEKLQQVSPTLPTNSTATSSRRIKSAP